MKTEMIQTLINDFEDVKKLERKLISDKKKGVKNPNLLGKKRKD